MTTPPPPDQPYTIPIIVPGPPSAPPPATAPPEPPVVTSSRPGWVVPVVAALAVLVLAGAGGVAYLVATRPPAQPAAGTSPATTAPPPTTRPAILDDITVSGIFVLIDDDEHWKVGADCEGDGGYNDIRVGADVVVSASGTDLATASLFGGIAQQQGNRVVCKFAFFLVGVPAGKGVYTLTIGHRSSKLNENELRQELDLSLGG